MSNRAPASDISTVHKHICNCRSLDGIQAGDMNNFPRMKQLATSLVNEAKIRDYYSNRGSACQAYQALIQA